MRKTVLRTTVAGAALLLACAAGAAAIVLRLPPLVVKTDGGFTPTTLPKHRYAPIKLHGYGKISTEDGSIPPALEEDRPLVRQARRSRDPRPAGLHDEEAARHRHQAGAPPLPRRDRRQGLRQGDRLLPRIEADPGLLADHALQRPAQARQPDRPRPRLPQRAGADHLHRPGRDPEGPRRPLRVQDRRQDPEDRRRLRRPRLRPARDRPRMDLQGAAAELRERQLPRRPAAGQRPVPLPRRHLSARAPC